MSKTPQFDKALAGYFAGLKIDAKGGQWRTCRFSGEKFYVHSDNVVFYQKISVPLPTLSPHERRRRRCASYNAYTLFKKSSAFSGQSVVSIYPPNSPFKIYEHKIWYSDEWDPLKYSREYTSTQSFFDQLYQLQLIVPRPSLISDPGNINSDYTNVSRNLKNCYFTFDQYGGEDLYYHQCCIEDKNCIECWGIDFSDTCYECKLGERLFKCFFCEESKNCTESYFLWDCRNCDYCFMSSNLRNKKYYFRNSYMGKDEYDQKIKEVYLGSYQGLEALKKEFLEVKLNAPRKPDWNEKSVNVFGDYIKNSKNINYGLYVQDSENLSYCEGITGSRDSYDVLGGVNNELCYEIANIWSENDYGCKFSMQIDNCREVELCDLCRNCRNCFGCVGLVNKEFCVFNRPYTEKEYWPLVDQIKSQMLVDGEYGEFFPPRYLPFPYRTTTVAYYYGFWDFDNAQKYGYDTSSIEISVEGVAGGEVIKAEDLPDDIKNVSDHILNKIILDTKNNKNFRIIKPELDFYRKYSLPLPREHPTSRMSAWRKLFGVTVSFYQKLCSKCGKEIITTYTPDRPEKNIYCEACYLKEVG